MTASLEGAKGVTGVVVYRNQERLGGSGHGSGHCAPFPPRCHVSRVLRECKVYGYLGLELDRLAVEAVRKEAPLPYRVSSRLNQLRIASSN
jgi:hypothetical protein